MNRRHDVVVAGGGVVGAAAALALRRAGFDVALVERGSAPAPFDAAHYDPRVYFVSPGSVRLLDDLRVWPQVGPVRAGACERMHVWDRDFERALRFDAAECAVPQLGFIVEESLLRSALWAALGGAGVHANQGWTGFGVRDGHAWLRLTDSTALEAEVVVAADGADSALRQAAGIDTAALVYDQSAIVCHVATQRPHAGSAWQRFLPEGPLAFLPLPDGRASIVWSVATERAEELMALSDAAFRERLAEAVEHRLGEITAATKRHAFPLRRLHAEAYVREHLALVGDSAHVIHPLAGQGVNLGLADVRELARVLVEARTARRPLGDLRVLQRYERARRADNLEMLALTDALQQAFERRTPAWNTLLNFGLAAVDRLGALKRGLTARAMGL